MFFCRVSGCLLCLIALIAPVHGQQAGLWDIGPSAVFEDRAGSSTELRLIFQTPGGDYAAQGATAGASLFEGERDGQKGTGIAWGFTPRFPSERHAVTGSLSAT